MRSRGEPIEAPARTDHERLLEAARAAARSAHCPYSSFRVGAAVRASSGAVFTGANVENASYGLSMCAERVALFGAVARGDGPPEALALACIDAPPEEPAARMPCGACLQVMVELMHPDAVVIVDGVGSLALAELLPRAFRLPARRG